MYNVMASQSWQQMFPAVYTVRRQCDCPPHCLTTMHMCELTWHYRYWLWSHLFHHDPSWSQVEGILLHGQLTSSPYMYPAICDHTETCSHTLFRVCSYKATWHWSEGISQCSEVLALQVQWQSTGVSRWITTDTWAVPFQRDYESSSVSVGCPGCGMCTLWSCSGAM